MVERLRAAKRVRIVGGPGSGKSTLAEALGRATGVEPIDLDRLKYPVPTGPALEKGERTRLLIREIERERWIADGIYLGFSRPTFETADLIVFLDTPVRTAVRRCILRHVRLTLSRRNPSPGLRRLKSFLRYVRWFYTVTLQEQAAEGKAEVSTVALTRRWCAEWPEKTLILNARDASATIEALRRLVD